LWVDVNVTSALT